MFEIDGICVNTIDDPAQLSKFNSFSLQLKAIGSEKKKCLLVLRA